MRVICRYATNDWEALRIAECMEDAGIQVFSITWLNKHYSSVNQFGVYGRYEDGSVSIMELDSAINLALFPNKKSEA